MNTPKSLSAVAEPVISLVPHADLRDTLHRTFSDEEDAVKTIEAFFRMLPTAAWSTNLLRTFAGSWKATHLKMLAIYGLSCRLQRMADGASDPERSHLYLAAARNAETSYEDLGLDFDAKTHAELFEEFAEALTGDDSWQLGKYRLAEARRFSRWIYRNMVVEPIADGLLTNMFSEIYNHGEYSIALPAADAYLARHTSLSADERRQAVTYIAAHVEDDTEADHFLVVVEALDRYRAATKEPFDAARAGSLFRAYLRNLAPVMQKLRAMMQAEMTSEMPVAVTAGGRIA
jgi:hypothetical protein